MSVNIYCQNTRDPVFTISSLELSAKSCVLRKLLLGINTCDACQEPLSVIFAEEEVGTVVSAMSQMAHFKKKTGLTIIQGKIS